MVNEYIDQGLITQAMEELRSMADGCTNSALNIHDRIEQCETEFQYMSQFMLSGGKDPRRAELFEELKQRLRNILYDLQVNATLLGNPQVKLMMQQTAGGDTSTETLQAALLSAATANEEHEALCRAFTALLTSMHWTRTQCEEWVVFLSSPQVSTTAQATLVSAVTLSALENICWEKTLCLAQVYRNSSKPLVRQRAFTGCLLALCQVSNDKYLQERQAVLDAMQQPLEGVAELFMLMNACANVDQDAREINSKIMPEILRHQPFEITKDGIREKEEGEDSDADMDAMEQGIKKMLQMQKNGTDIFFAGFSQMKRFPFFRNTANWFMPFYKEHPDISAEARATLNTKFVERVISHGPFCESDKYSFVIAMEMTMRNMPDNVRHMMEEGDMGPIGMHKDGDDMNAPTLLRMQYLQDLYRFYRLSQLGTTLRNPFNDLQKCLLGIATATATTDKEKRSLCLYMMKKDGGRQTQKAVAQLLNRFNDLDSYERHYCHAELMMLKKDYAAAIPLYNKCIEKKNGDTAAMRSLARAHYLNADYEKAAFYYDALHTMHPERTSYLLNYCMATTMAGKAQDILNDLYRLEFNGEANTTTTNTLVWALLHANKPEQALTTAKGLLDRKEAQGNFSIILNATYAYLANNLIAEAADTLKTYAATLSRTERNNLPTMLMQNMKEDSRLLNQYGINEAEQAIIASLAV